VRAKETKKFREAAYFEALYQDIRTLELAREAAWDAKLQGELTTAQESLGLL
jgi:hypothetical protein